MTFKKRLRYYLIGFGIGIAMSVIIFGSRGCDWTPGNRVLKQIATSEILISDSVKCILRNNAIDEDDIFKIFENDGDVIFSESNPQGKPKTYVIQNTKKHFKILFTVQNDSVSVISGVAGGKKAGCDTVNADLHIFQMPEGTVKRILRDKLNKSQLSATDSILNMLEQQKISHGDIYNMIGAGKIDFEKSTPMSKPHPIYYVDYKNYRFKIEMAEERTRILEFWVK